MPDAAWHALHLASKALVRWKIRLAVEGEEHLPRSGPILLAARHFHHLYDGCILLATINRPAHILVGLDWLQQPLGRIVMHAACRAAGWPIVYRPDSPYPVRPRAPRQEMLRATRETIGLLRAGRVVIVFPEAYPTIDPGRTLKTSLDEFLPFRAGFARFALLAARTGLRVPVVPVGLTYEPASIPSASWSVNLRFGKPIWVDQSYHAPVAQLVECVQQRVQELSERERSR